MQLREPTTVSESHVEGFPMTAGMLKMTHYAIIRIAQHLFGDSKRWVLGNQAQLSTQQIGSNGLRLRPSTSHQA